MCVYAFLLVCYFILPLFFLRGGAGLGFTERFRGSGLKGLGLRLKRSELESLPKTLKPGPRGLRLRV